MASVSPKSLNTPISAHLTIHYKPIPNTTTNFDPNDKITSQPMNKSQIRVVRTILNINSNKNNLSDNSSHSNHNLAHPHTCPLLDQGNKIDVHDLLQCVHEHSILRRASESHIPNFNHTPKILQQQPSPVGAATHPLQRTVSYASDSDNRVAYLPTIPSRGSFTNSYRNDKKLLPLEEMDDDDSLNEAALNCKTSPPINESSSEESSSSRLSSNKSSRESLDEEQEQEQEHDHKLNVSCLCNKHHHRRNSVAVRFNKAIYKEF